ncbi:RagB/SusD family nutrient uptake outer membrane protein [Maribacter ulvicola]|uniref:Starch-binding associating with outer membrane n=1 Tax=Maribacter ulvicola TaxID=228959 RepID=A0A1N6X6N2_9FLAO|nr:RagB/SusD family nutrient uptake outer membrane protein [Maribacter ulvicola]SIQ97901.1 Starch-binding associating with outer membrane [Maribacter ulvicola]
MKKNKYIVAISVVLFSIVSCTELDLVPLDTPTTSPFVSTQQFREGLNEGYRHVFWIEDDSDNGIDDDKQVRTSLDRIKAGTLTAEDGTVANNWSVAYKAISRILSVKKQIENQNGVLSDNEINTFLGEANFLIASNWAYLITHFGDVPFYESQLSVEETFEMSRTDKATILQKVYAYYDIAISNLPVSYSGYQYATKGAALAMKARTALYMGDFETAAQAAKDCMDLGVYELHPDFSELFSATTRNSKEHVFTLPRNEELNIVRGDRIRWYMPRNHGGWGGQGPTWALLASFECIDGLPIDESPLFDPQNPFKNRDPRCAKTIIPFGSLEEGDGLLPRDGSNFLGIEFNPHPEKKEVMNFNTGELTRNNDSRSIGAFAPFNGLLWNKGVEETWKNPFRPDPNRMIMRYADVLLMYAEAKIELNQIDASVLNAMNQVRDRAYANSGHSNPTITTTNQAELRYKIRNERRAEFAFEKLRYMDLIRWRIAEKAITGFHYGLADVAANADVNIAPTGPLMDNVVTPGLWFWGLTPELDEDGIADFNPLVAAGMAKVLAETNFPERQYLYPIPIEETLLSPNLLPNNPGY